MSEPVTDPAVLIEAYEMMDDYTGPEAKRATYLADQWTCWGDRLSDEGMAELVVEAERVIAAWRTERIERAA